MYDPSWSTWINKFSINRINFDNYSSKQYQKYNMSNNVITKSYSFDVVFLRILFFRFLWFDSYKKYKTSKMDDEHLNVLTILLASSSFCFFNDYNRYCQFIWLTVSDSFDGNINCIGFLKNSHRFAWDQFSRRIKYWEPNKFIVLLAIAGVQ